jgi:hypothetical protein
MDNRDPDLLPCQGCIRWADAGRCIAPSRQ